MAGSSRNIIYYDFMGVGSGSDPNSATTVHNSADRDQNSWPIKRELTPAEVRDDVFYMNKQEFETYILPRMPPAQRKRLTRGSVVQIILKDERCVFFMTQLYMYEEYYVLTNFRCQRENFIRSKELVAGQKIWLRWTNSYMELKVIK